MDNFLDLKAYMFAIDINKKGNIVLVQIPIKRVHKCVKMHLISFANQYF